MKIYSNHITAPDVRAAFAKARQDGADIWFDYDQSRTWGPRGYKYGLEFGAYSISGRYHRGTGTTGAGRERAPSWTDYGYVIAHLFNIDPHARIGIYDSEADFVEKVTKHQPRDGSLDFLGVLDNIENIGPEYRPLFDRRARGSLRGKLVVAEDWDSDEVNESIARDFGMTQ